MVSSHQPGFPPRGRQHKRTVYPATSDAHRQAPPPGVRVRLTPEAYLT
jgi:hypothetical protein